MPVADRPWWEGGAAVLSENWAKGMVACFHSIPDRIDMGMGIEKCAWCNEIRERGGFWPPTTAPELTVFQRQQRNSDGCCDD